MGATAIWQGFDYKWRKDPHRLNRFGCFIDNLAEVANDHITGRYTSDMKFGEFRDVADAFTFVTRINCQDLSFIHGSTQISLTGALGQEKTVDGNVINVSLQHPTATGPLTGTVILRGFNVECNSHAAGINTRGFGVNLMVGTKHPANTVSFQPRFMIHPQGSPDRPNPSPPHYTYTLRAHYTVIVAPQGAANFQLTRGSGASGPVVGTNYEGPRSQVARTTVDMTGATGLFNRGVVGIRGFQWHLAEWPKTKHDGRYLRRLVSAVKNTSYFVSNGKAQFQAENLFSNEPPKGLGICAYGYLAFHQIATTLIQYNDERQPVTNTLHNVVEADINNVAQQAFVL